MPTKSKKRPVKEVPVTESRSAEAITVAWTVTVTTLIACNLAIIGAHYFSLQYPDNDGLRTMREMLLISGCGLGAISLVLLPIVYRSRIVVPPTGLAVFGACMAIAPILALLVRNLR